MIVKVVEKDVMDPVAKTGDHKIKLNKVDPDFKKLTLFNNTKPGADVILNYLGESLGKLELIRVKKPAGAPATPNQLETAAMGEVAILGLGDCGSCSSWVILDAIRLEKLGIPTISICSTSFSEFSHELAKAHGAEHLNIVTVQHPIAGTKTSEIQDKTRQILPLIKKLLGNF
jgi:hypothetical protein